MKEIVEVEVKKMEDENIATVTKNAIKEMGLVSLDEAKTKTQNGEEWKSQTFNKYITKNF